MNRWLRAWRAAKSAFLMKEQEDIGLVLDRKKLMHFIDLQCQHELREKELAASFPELDFTIRALAESGQQWEWFPPLERLNGEEAGSAYTREQWLLHDLKRHERDYDIVSQEEGVGADEAVIRLLSPGIRARRSGQTIVKAKISLHRKKKQQDVRHMLDDLSEI